MPCRSDALSPAHKLFGHPVQDSLPAHRCSFAHEWQQSSEEADKISKATHEYAEQACNQHAQELPDLNIGSHVAIQSPTSKLWDIYGIVTALASHRRYLVKTKMDVCWSETVAFFASEFQYPLEHQIKNFECESLVTPPTI